ncbi:double-strand break repair helicase AddA [Erythrobacter sp. HKB08]|uniref:double-strand break repair helicase AddA n=1 Tax=Erythrobacter sp. HKB08 TaxID=2502843 RepID=UPI001008F960|nr:double-strand break repair helicase AddA [Erythrobacter sp. HKB08]
MSGKVYPLSPNQSAAVEPLDSVWLSASAGTGKTQVLSARVLRLLLQEDVDPSQILCLTFTKAGAAEMANRVSEVLAGWVRMPDEVLGKDLLAIGARNDAATISRARGLFACVLDCPGGGLRIDTIHAFSQWLLSAFPEEAGLRPGTRAMEDRDREVLAQQVLSDMLVEWQRDGETEMLDALADLSIRMGPGEARAWMLRCGEARDLWFGAGGWQDDLEPRLRGVLGIPADADESDLAQLCSDEAFDVASLRACIADLEAWGTATADKGIASINAWLSLEPADRLESLHILSNDFFKKADFETPDRGASRGEQIEKKAPGYIAHTEAVSRSLDTVFELRNALQLVAWLAPALRIGRRFALKWDEAKKREGFVDFDDLIRNAAGLLSRADMADWIRFKLDRRFDHILVDEAQDTNAAQWLIIKKLAEEFYAGKGQRDGKMRTVFVVGDYKQAIFRFQGTSPENFEAAKRYFEKEMAEAAKNAAQLRENIDARELQDLDLDRSYRTSQPILDFVDKAIASIGPRNIGLKEDPPKHEGATDRPGEVVLWKPVSMIPDEDEEEEEPEERQQWISPPERLMADKLAEQVRCWLDEGYPLFKGEKRNAGPGDIMILVRKRRELAGLIVARLHAAGIPVAGVDRLRIGAPLAVQDLMAALRFAAQPLDDLNLANLLVSPLGGWSQDDLLEHGYRAKNVRLWDHVRKSEHPFAMATTERLRDLLRRADFEPVQALLHWILVGPWQGRRNLVARLGGEANDPIDELLNAAQAFASAHTPSLQGFIRWFDAGEGELKREAGESSGLVRVMTVHGSKGLQAPIVILADAVGDPDRSLSSPLELPDGDRSVPIPALSARDSIPRIEDAKAAAAAEEREEHWRLLYVAMTRAEEALFLGGALLSKEKAPAPDSWHARLEPLFDGDPEDDPIWGYRRTHGARGEAHTGLVPSEREDVTAELPDWATRPIGPEPRPPRPLAPSAAGEDAGADPPLPPDIAKEAARRGVLIHALLERVPQVAAADREEKARQWLAKQADDLGEEAREEMLQSALTVLDTPEFTAIFAPDALAEIPLAATVEGQVVAGTADRLLVEEKCVTVVDFKTARRPPSTLAEVPQTTIRQMAAYAAALERIYPGREVRAAVLYTQTPQLIAIPAAMLAEGKGALSTTQESYPPESVE